jgi:dTDP-4-dehydrorhamnose reductase
LLTRDEGHYEPGAFDLKDGVPRETKVARCIRHLAQFGAHPPERVQPGWWERESRITVRLSASA